MRSRLVMFSFNPLDKRDGYVNLVSELSNDAMRLQEHGDMIFFEPLVDLDDALEERDDTPF